MLTNNDELKGLVIRASDGEIGTVEDLYFDDEVWAIRYLTVETGSWLNGRKVLISPHSILHTDWKARRIDVALTRKQVENSPGIDTHRPISRQHEAEYSWYYGYPYYWDGPDMWGTSYSPAGLIPIPMAVGPLEEQIRKQSADSHLRSTDAVTGYFIVAKDGEIGHISRFVVDDEAWAIRYLEVATRNWWPGKKVLVSPTWVERVSWEQSTVDLATTRKAIQTCPEYTDAVPITREYENNLCLHYGWRPYWKDVETARAAYALGGV